MLTTFGVSPLRGHAAPPLPAQARRDVDQVLATVHDELADRDLPALGQRIAQDDIALVGVVAVRQKVIGFSK